MRRPMTFWIPGEAGISAGSRLIEAPVGSTVSASFNDSITNAGLPPTRANKRRELAATGPGGKARLSMSASTSAPSSGSSATT